MSTEPKPTRNLDYYFEVLTAALRRNLDVRLPTRRLDDAVGKLQIHIDDRGPYYTDGHGLPIHLTPTNWRDVIPPLPGSDTAGMLDGIIERIRVACAKVEAELVQRHVEAFLANDYQPAIGDLVARRKDLDRDGFTRTVLTVVALPSREDFARIPALRQTPLRKNVLAVIESDHGVLELGGFLAHELVRLGSIYDTGVTEEQFQRFVTEIMW
jgi:hypothetical protein